MPRPVEIASELYVSGKFELSGLSSAGNRKRRSGDDVYSVHGEDLHATAGHCDHADGKSGSDELKPGDRAAGRRLLQLFELGHLRARPTTEVRLGIHQP